MVNLKLNFLAVPVILFPFGHRYRAEVRAVLEAIPTQLQLVSLSGLTGTGKTTLLLHLRSKGFQVLDLEGLANHRGSLLGAADLPPQPSQKLFESRLADALSKLDPSQPVWIEAESSKVVRRVGVKGVRRLMRRSVNECEGQNVTAAVLFLLAGTSDSAFH